MSSIWAIARCSSESVARKASAASTTSAAFGEASKLGAGEAAGAVCAAARGAAEPRLAARKPSDNTPAAAARASVPKNARRQNWLCFMFMRFSPMFGIVILENSAPSAIAGRPLVYVILASVASIGS